ncbi:MAG: hypothetical protein HYX75_24050 [Acidobacteria bacterium]|nr:hypothetical protein [Acidobacteriota bacterium]
MSFNLPRLFSSRSERSGPDLLTDGIDVYAQPDGRSHGMHDQLSGRFRGAVVFSTQNAQYHVTDGACTAIIDLNSRRSSARRDALGMRLLGHCPPRSLQVASGQPPLGNCLVFSNQRKFVITSPISEIL